MKKKVLIRFGNPRYLPSEVDGIFIYYPYELIFIASEKYKLDTIDSANKGVRVAISGSLAITWGFQIWQQEVHYDDLKKLLFMYSLELIKEKLNNGTLKDYEELALTTQTHPTKRIYDISKIPEVFKYEEEVIITNGNEAETITSTDIHIGDAIVQTRDNINAIFYSLFRQKLLLTDQERNVLDVFKPVKKQEEFFSRIASLGSLVGNINKEVLKQILPVHDQVEGSVNLLGKYIEHIGGNSSEIIQPIKHIIRMRQSYPVHTDKADGVLDSYIFFNIEYPIKNFEEAWDILLKAYQTSLIKLIELIKVIK